jgi:hypothetical protein
MDKKIKKEPYEICGSHVPGYNTVYLSSEEKRTLVCLKCYNQKISDSTGFDYEHVEFEPIMIKDIDGVDHKFHFIVQLLSDRVPERFVAETLWPEFQKINDELNAYLQEVTDRVIKKTPTLRPIYWGTP